MRVCASRPFGAPRGLPGLHDPPLHDTCVFAAGGDEVAVVAEEGDVGDVTTVPTVHVAGSLGETRRAVSAKPGGVRSAGAPARREAGPGGWRGVDVGRGEVQPQRLLCWAPQRSGDWRQGWGWGVEGRRGQVWGGRGGVVQALAQLSRVRGEGAGVGGRGVRPRSADKDEPEPRWGQGSLPRAVGLPPPKCSGAVG